MEHRFRNDDICVSDSDAIAKTKVARPWNNAQVNAGSLPYTRCTRG